MLVEPPGVEGVPGVVFDDDAEMDEPVMLEGFPEVPRGVGRDPLADFGDAQELFLAGRVFLLGRQLRGPGRVAPAEDDEGLGGDAHAPQLFALVQSFGIVQEIEGGDGRVDVGDEVEHALAVDLVVQDGVPGSPLLHELSEYAGFVGVLPFLGQLGHHPVADGAAAPEGDDLLLIKADRGGVGLEPGLGPGIEDAQVLGAMASDFGVGRRSLGPRAPLADNELAFIHNDGLVLQDVLEGQGVLDGRRDPVGFRRFIEFGDQLGPLTRDRGDRFQALVAQLFYPGGHVILLLLR